MKNTICLFILFLVACNEKYDNKKPAPFDQGSLDAISESLCSNGKVAKEVSFSNDMTFIDLRTLAQAVGFYSGEKSCAIEGDITEPVPIENKTYYLEARLQGKCLANNSFWNVIKFESIGSDVIYVLESRETSGVTVSLRASRDLPLTYARDRVGLRALSCQ